MTSKIAEVFVVSDNRDKVFWDMVELLIAMPISIVKKYSLVELFAYSGLKKASAIIISSGMMSESGIEQYLMNKEIICCPVVVAGSYEKKQQEYRMRQTGISCFLLLPEEASMILDFLEIIVNQ